MGKNLPSYVPFARKYRPKNFTQLVGQGVLTRTLSYCIASKKLPGAILLTGVRGVGKTSSARIIAKTINCTSLSVQDLSRVLPCEKCKNCESLNKNCHPDVIEMDAASRTGIEDVKKIIENSEYRPLLGEYKVFIVDEIHMLSKSAFNALLKLIEEPPAYLIFIFATTEVQKIPLTVLSRCQRYDLNRLSFQESLTLLETIAKNEDLKFEDDALKIIALKSEGSAREAISILDQTCNFHNPDDNGIITAKSVNTMLGLVQTSTILALVRLITDANARDAIKLLEDVYVISHSLEHLIQQISDFIAVLIKYKVIQGFHDPLYKNYSTEITDLLIGLSLSKLSILWQIFNKGTGEVKSSYNELVAAQMLIIKAIYSCSMPPIEEILDSASSNIDDFPKITETASRPPTSTARIDNQDKANDETNIFNFLKFCHAQNEMELYYLLLNEIEVKNFSRPLMEIAATTKISQEKNLKSMLRQWSGVEWNVIISVQKEFKNLKSHLLEKAGNSEDFAIIKKKFPNANISDIILKQ